ncbi:MAG: M28 family peptidase [Candidatus Zixiibacteriota bacterium]
MSNIRLQVSLGPRVPGSAASKKCRDVFVAYFDSLGVAVDSQPFLFSDPYTGSNIPMVNFVATIPGKDTTAQRILLLTHYDSRPRAERSSNIALREQPIPGANDGASGTAVLMEIARILKLRIPPVGIDLLFTDGEDWGKPGDAQNYLLGAREFARASIRDKYRFAILIDMVGDASQQIYRESFSQTYYPALNDLVWSTAADAGITSFVDSTRHAVQDDHIPISAAGVPTIDIIDFDYPYWHTELDTVDKCSAQSLANVGRVLASILYNPARWPFQ